MRLSNLFLSKSAREATNKHNELRHMYGKTVYNLALDTCKDLTIEGLHYACALVSSNMKKVNEAILSDGVVLTPNEFNKAAEAMSRNAKREEITNGHLRRLLNDMHKDYADMKEHTMRMGEKYEEAAQANEILKGEIEKLQNKLSEESRVYKNWTAAIDKTYQNVLKERDTQRIRNKNLRNTLNNNKKELNRVNTLYTELENSHNALEQALNKEIAEGHKLGRYTEALVKKIYEANEVIMDLKKQLYERE